MPSTVFGIDGEYERSTNIFLALELTVCLGVDNTLGTLKES